MTCGGQNATLYIIHETHSLATNASQLLRMFFPVRAVIRPSSIPLTTPSPRISHLQRAAKGMVSTGAIQHTKEVKSNEQSPPPTAVRKHIGPGIQPNTNNTAQYNSSQKPLPYPSLKIAPGGLSTHASQVAHQGAFPALLCALHIRQ